MDHLEGYNFAAALVKRDFPFTVSSNVNKPFKTGIYANSGLLRNISLINTFNNNYIKTN